MIKKKILLIDDDEGIRDLLYILLKRAGYDVETQRDDVFMNEEGRKHPDLYLIDRQLGGINGLEICSRLKGNALTSKIPVFMISASPDIANLSSRAGADGFIEKPFSTEYLLQTIAKAVE